MKFFSFLILLCFASFPIEPSCWKTLEPRDEIALIAPSGKPSAVAVTTIKRLITEKGYVPVIYYNEASGDFGRSDSLERRRDCFLSALHSSTKVIWSLRGGNGASGIFKNPELFETFQDMPPKLLIGFSDFTAIHLWANSIGWPSLHGIVASFCMENDHAVNAQTSIEPYFNILSGQFPEISYNLTCENEPSRAAVIEDSSIIGGNLSLIQRSMGTPRQPNTNGKILFVEDILEPGRKINEALAQLQEASLFDGVRAVIWGKISGDAADIGVAKRLLNEDLTQRGIPLFSADFFGHDPLNSPLPFNTPAKIGDGKLVVRTNKH